MLHLGKTILLRILTFRRRFGRVGSVRVSKAKLLGRRQANLVVVVCKPVIGLVFKNKKLMRSETHQHAVPECGKVQSGDWRS